MYNVIYILDLYKPSIFGVHSARTLEYCEYWQPPEHFVFLRRMQYLRLLAIKQRRIRRAVCT